MRRRHRSWSSFSDATIDYILDRMPKPPSADSRRAPNWFASGVLALGVLGSAGLLLACPLWLLLYALGNVNIFDSLAVWGAGFLWLVGLGLFLLGVGPQPKWRIILSLLLVGEAVLFGAHLLGGGDRFFQAVFCLFWGTAFWWHAESRVIGPDGEQVSRSARTRWLALAITSTAYVFATLLSLPAGLVSATPWLTELATWRPATFLWMAHWLLVQLPGQQAVPTAETPAHRAALHVTRERDERDWNDR